MAGAAVSANRLELLQIADAVAREKSIDQDVVLVAMEEAIQKAANTGRIGDGKIFVFDILKAVRIRTGETDKDAI